MNTIIYIIITVIVTVAVMSAGYAILKARKSGSKDVPWEKIRPILTDTFIRIKEVSHLKKIGYQATEDYAVKLVKEQIQKANFLNETEKSLINDDLIRSVIGPRLKEIYEEKSKK